MTGVAFLGADAVADVTCDNGLSLRVRARPDAAPRPGDRLTVGIPEDAVWPVPEPDPDLTPAAAAGPP